MNCKICFESYDSNRRPPVTLIPCGHSLCGHCLNAIRYASAAPTCPHCRCEIFDSKPNYDLIEVLEQRSLLVVNPARPPPPPPPPATATATAWPVSTPPGAVSLKEMFEHDLKLVNERLRQGVRASCVYNNPDVSYAIGRFKKIYNQIKRT